MAAARKSLVSNTGKRGWKGFYSVSLWRLVWQVHRIALLFSQKMIFRGLHWRREFLNYRRAKNWGLAVKEIPLKVSLKLHHRSSRKADQPPCKYYVQWTLMSFRVNSTWCLTSEAWSNLFHNFYAAQRCWWDWWCKFLFSWGASCFSYYHAM